MDQLAPSTAGDVAVLQPDEPEEPEHAAVPYASFGGNRGRGRPWCPAHWSECRHRLCGWARTRGHPSPVVFYEMSLRKKMHLVGMSSLSFLLSKDVTYPLICLKLIYNFFLVSCSIYIIIA